MTGKPGRLSVVESIVVRHVPVGEQLLWTGV
jgi:hypothetical protein